MDIPDLPPGYPLFGDIRSALPSPGRQNITDQGQVTAMIKEKEFQHLYDTFGKSLVRYGLHHGVEIEISKELTHQAYLLLLVKHDEIILRHKNLPGWLIKTNHNLIKRELKSARRKYEVSMSDDFDFPSPEVYQFPLGDIMPAGLSQRHKTILVLRYEDRLSYKEIADRMGISPGYVGVLLSRALQDLRKLYDSEEKRLSRDGNFIA